MDEQYGQETLDVNIEELAVQMLTGESDSESEEYYYDEDDDDDYEDGDSRNVGHPAWNEILSQVPSEFHSSIIPTLDKWDKGVSRRFQKIHDEYAPLKQYSDIDPDDLDQAMSLYTALASDPKAAWEAIGRVYGLSPQNIPQASPDSYGYPSVGEDEDFDFNDLPKAVRDRLLKLDQHDAVLEGLAKEALDRQAYEQEAAEDEALENYLDALEDEYGEFDVDYVLGLIAAGIDGEEAVERYQQIMQSNVNSYDYPTVMSSSGAIPYADSVDVTRLSNSDTQNLIAEILRLSNNEI